MRRARLDKLAGASVDPASILAAARKFQSVESIFIPDGDNEIAIIGNPVKGNDEMPHHTLCGAMWLISH